MKTDRHLLGLIAESVNRVRMMSPAEREAMLMAQGESWARAEASWPPAGTGMTRDQILARIAQLDEMISQAIGWGAAIGEMNEERGELHQSLVRHK